MSANVKRSQKPLICVVDDDFLLRESTIRLLRSCKFNVKALASAEEFLNSECLAEAACLILDVCIPGMSGLELQRQLVVDHSDLPIIFITAHEDEIVGDKPCRPAPWRFCISLSMSKSYSMQSMLL